MNNNMEEYVLKLKFEKKTKLEDYLNSIEPRFYPLVAFALTALVYGITLSGMGLMGNGLYVLETGDLRIQIIPFIMRFCDVIRGKHDYWYSWNLALGSGSAGTYAYYTLSPFNIFYLILGSKGVHYATFLVTVLKASTAALTFQFFISRYLRINYYETILFSMMYALCGNMICFYHAILNMDAVLIFPLIMLGIVSLIREEKISLLMFSYTYLIGVQLYMGYVAGISSFILFFVYYFYNRNIYSLKERFRIILKYIFCTCFALGITAFIWLPAILNILEMNNFSDLYNHVLHCDILLILNNLFIGQYQSLDGFAPYIYCGILTTIAIPSFFLNKRICIRKRYYYGVSIAIFIFIMLVPPLNIAIQGFDQPNKVGFRYAFVLSFIFLLILSEQFAFIRGNRIKPIYIKIFLLSSVFLFFVCKFILVELWGKEYDSNKIWIIGINILFIIIYFRILRIYKAPQIDKITIKAVLTTFVILELIINIVVCYKRIDANDSFFTDEYYVNAQNNTLIKIKNDVDDSMIRTIYADPYISNIAIMQDLGSLPIFSSIINDRLMNQLTQLGFAYGINSITGNGWTPITASLLGIDYIIDGKSIVSDDPNIPVIMEPNEHYYQYFAKNNKALPLAFYTNPDVLKYTSGDSVFDNQDNLLSLMVGRKVDCYSYTDMDVETDDAEIITSNDLTTIKNNNYPNEPAIVKYTSKESNNEIMYANLYNNEAIFDGDVAIPLVSKYNGYLNNTIVPMLYPNQIVQVGLDDNDYGILTMNIPAERKEISYKKGYFVYYHQEVFDSIYNELYSHGMKINKFADGYVSGELSCNENSVLFTSIPYEKGWNAYVNGVKTKVIPLLENAFVGIELEPGKHEIILEYIAPGRNVGRVITLSTIILSTLLMVWSRNKRTQR